MQTQEHDLIEQAQHQAALLRTLGIALPSAVYLLDMEKRSLKFVGGVASSRPAALARRRRRPRVLDEIGSNSSTPKTRPRVPGPLGGARRA